MNGGTSSSNPPPPPPPPPAAAAPTLLAPGFRFHPTDEELVIYYLKRKVSGRPLRVDAIAEVDLYKTEPWDLPSLSRLRTGDMEWYFFSSLECKYANRSRTNRTTAQGYWKTTGKDRPVRHGQRTVGMKKTLVFHAGRAPRGERTNWVMHEYRLEDEELARAGVPQDAYVLCRIFQKSGTGPQNGAQYGAPFVEEEWEGIENLGMADIVDGQDSGDTDNLGSADAVVVAAGDEGFLQLADFENKQNQHNQHESTDPLAASSTDEQNISNRSEDPIFLVEGIFQGHIPGDDMQAPGLQDYQTSYYDMGQNVSLAGQSHSPPIGTDGYLQLNDFGDMVKVGFHSSEDSVGSVFDASNDQIAVNQLDESSNVPKSHGTDVFFDNVNGNIKSNDMLQISPAQDPFFLELNDLLNLDYPLEDNVGFYDPSNNDHLFEDNAVFYDASNNDQLFEEENFLQMQDLYPPLANPCELNSMEDVMAYFDPIENSTQGSLETCIGSSSTKRSTMEADVSSVLPYNTNPESSVMNVGVSSQLVTPQADNQLSSVCEKVTAAPDSQKKDGRGGTFSKRITNLLGSFSAPPAYAAESVASPSKSSVRSAAASSASSIHVSAGMIDIDGSNMKGMADHWSLHKNENNGFLFSFGVAGNVFVNSECSESMINMQGWAMSVALRGGFYIFLLLALLLVLCFRVGMGVCSR